MDSGRTVSADVAEHPLRRPLGAVLAEGVVEFDARRCIQALNPAAESLTGHAAGTLRGCDAAKLFHRTNGADAFSVAPGGPAELSLVLRTAEGEPLPVYARVYCVAGDDGSHEWLLAFFPKGRVRAIEQLKNELVSTVSHELKTPLAAIKAYASTLRNGEMPEQQRDEFLGVIEQQADRLSRLVDDMLMVSRVESAQLLRRRVIVPLDEVLDAAIAGLTFDPAVHQVTRRTAGTTVSGDPERLRDVFRNLLENAVKYSPRGGTIEVRAQAAPDCTVVEISDSGVGIASEHLPYIFDRFYRVESPSTASVGGSGLGLYIAGALVRAHGGAVNVRSEPGEGTTFSVMLPVRA